MSYIFTKNGKLIPEQSNILLEDTSKSFISLSEYYYKENVSGWSYGKIANSYAEYDNIIFYLPNYVKVENGSITNYIGCYSYSGETGRVKQYIILKKPFKNNMRFFIEGQIYNSAKNNEYSYANYINSTIGFTNNPQSTTINVPWISKSSLSTDRLYDGEKAFISFSFTGEIKNDILYYKGYYIYYDSNQSTSPDFFYKDENVTLNNNHYLIIYFYHGRVTDDANPASIIIRRIILY